MSRAIRIGIAVLVSGLCGATASCMALVNDGDYKVGDASASDASGSQFGPDGTVADGTVVGAADGTVDAPGIDTAKADTATGSDGPTTASDSGARDSGAAQDTGIRDSATGQDSAVARDTGLAQDTGSPSCVLAADASACTVCERTSCCNELTACDTSAECTNLRTCYRPCTTSACIDTCNTQHPVGVPILDAVSTCYDSNCVECGASGIGDPCPSPHNACDIGLTCLSAWCSAPSCLTGADCAGLSMYFANTGTTNIYGQTSACLEDTSDADVCFPGCATDTDCTGFPGTVCMSTIDVDGNPVQICSFP